MQCYRAIQKNFVDMENMFDLLNVVPEVIDAPAAPPLAITGGKVELRNVVFSYVPERVVLRNISFTVPPGQTFALVGSIFIKSVSQKILMFLTFINKNNDFLNIYYIGLNSPIMLKC